MCKIKKSIDYDGNINYTDNIVSGFHNPHGPAYRPRNLPVSYFLKGRQHNIVGPSSKNLNGDLYFSINGIYVYIQRI